MPVLMTRTDDIYLAAGLDAVVMLKTIEYGVQIFTPMAMLSLAICAPLVTAVVTTRIKSLWHFRAASRASGVSVHFNFSCNQPGIIRRSHVSLGIRASSTCVVHAVVPVHLKGGALSESSAQESVPFKRFTIANLRPQSELDGISIYWLHFALAYVFVFYSLWLMNYHYEVCSALARCLLQVAL